MEDDEYRIPLTLEKTIEAKVTSILYIQAGFKIEVAMRLANQIIKIKEIQNLLNKT